MKKKTAQEIRIEEMNNLILVHQREDRPGCYTANGFLICHCGKCKNEDYEAPKDHFEKR